MSMTPRFALPLLYPGQAQKELTHNEALSLLDMLLAPAAEGIANDPPAGAAPGQCWIVGPSPTGLWAGRADGIAGWTESGWRFARPVPGLAVRLGDGRRLRWSGAGWEAPTAVAEPSGGTTVDTEARASLSALIVALRSQGLLS